MEPKTIYNTDSDHDETFSHKEMARLLGIRFGGL